MARPVAENGFHPTLCVDFDAVIHQYTKWDGPVARAPPVQGAFSALRSMREEGYRVEVFSTRPRQNIIDWLKAHGAMSLVDTVRDGKPYYLGFFDDRAHNVPANQPNGLSQAFESFQLGRRILE